MEPSTPPRAHSSRAAPATPATPRFGTFQDLPDAERKQERTRTPHRRKRAAAELATPRQTPHKRKVLITPKQQLLFREPEPALSLVEEEEDDAEHEEAETEAESDEDELEQSTELYASEENESELSDDEQPAAAVHDTARARRDQTPQKQIRPPIQDAARGSEAEPLARGPDQRIAEPAVDWGHPHQDKPPPNVPGMWYVFRGKKVFRPLPPGAKPVEPVTLFQKEIAQRREAGAAAESEEDTDVEHAHAW